MDKYINILAQAALDAEGKTVPEKVIVIIESVAYAIQKIIVELEKEKSRLVELSQQPRLNTKIEINNLIEKYSEKKTLLANLKRGTIKLRKNPRLSPRHRINSDILAKINNLSKEEKKMTPEVLGGEYKYIRLPHYVILYLDEKGEKKSILGESIKVLYSSDENISDIYAVAEKEMQEKWQTEINKQEVEIELIKNKLEATKEYSSKDNPYLGSIQEIGKQIGYYRKKLNDIYLELPCNW